MKLLDLFRAWPQGPKQEMQLQVQQKTLAEKPPPEYKFQSSLPDWREGEIDENGNRFWMIDYQWMYGRGFIKYVERMPEWMKPYFREDCQNDCVALLRNPLLYLAAFHPGCLTINGALPTPPGVAAKAGLSN